jgi:hypothetical protein
MSLSELSLCNVIAFIRRWNKGKNPISLVMVDGSMYLVVEVGA